MQNEVHVGRAGWLFLAGGSNDVVGFYRYPEKLDASVVPDWCALLESRRERLSALGAQYLHVFAPDKLSVYPEHYSGSLENFQNRPILRVLYDIAKHDGLIQHVLDPLPYFVRQKEFHQLYWKTDTHWTFIGSFCAYQLICSKLSWAQREDLIARPYREGILAMDLGGKLDPPLRERVRFYQVLSSAKRTYANELVRFKEENNLMNEGGLHVGSHVIFENPEAPISARVVLFGDSFSEFRPILLTGLLAETVKELHFVWSTRLDYSYIREVKPDVVITEIAERFLPRVPVDNFDLSTYAPAILCEWTKSKDVRT